MQTNGYLNASHPNRAALTTTIALHALALAGLFAYNPAIVGDVVTYLPTYAVPVEPPPVPPPPRADLKRLESKTPPSATPTRSTDVAAEVPRWDDLAPPAPLDLGIGNGSGIIVEPQAPSTPEPVFVAAALDMRATRDLQPPYPAALQRAEIEGSVTVSLRIGTDGRVIEVTLVRADDPGFFAATRDWALRHWRFRPATRDGVPVTGTLTKTVRFVIDR